MENSFQTSFIPKKPITTTTNGSIKTAHGPTSIFTVFSFLLIIIIGISSVGLYFYKNYLIKQESVLSDSLEKVRVAFEKDTLDELYLYDKRVSAATQVLGQHIVFSPMFAKLGEVTIPAVQFISYNQDRGTTDKDFKVSLSGVASDYKSIALQADAFNSDKGRSFKNVVFSNINKQKNNVTFNIEFDVDPSLLSYEKNLALEEIEAKTKVKEQEIVPPTDGLTQPETLPTNNSQQ